MGKWGAVQRRAEGVSALQGGGGHQRGAEGQRSTRGCQGCAVGHSAQLGIDAVGGRAAQRTGGLRMALQRVGGGGCSATLGSPHRRGCKTGGGGGQGNAVLGAVRAALRSPVCRGGVRAVQYWGVPVQCNAGGGGVKHCNIGECQRSVTLRGGVSGQSRGGVSVQCSAGGGPGQ